MREIKFRAYHKKERRFYYFDLETVTHTVYVGYYHPITGEKDCELDDYSLYSEKQLYTGLKDKNGVEIYEGDIVSFALPNNQWSDGHEVKFHRGSFVTKSGGVFSLGFMANFENLELLKVIGSIYSNHELLGVNDGDS